MKPPIPEKDGDVKVYDLSNSGIDDPRIYFVNGIRVLPQVHAEGAACLSLLIERPVNGVYNKTAGLIVGYAVDTGQCLLDYAQNVTARLNSANNLNKPPKISEDKIAEFLANVDKKYVVWNQATLQLFKQLVLHRHQTQYIVAHSQGNLITSNALFVLEDLLGSGGLSKIRVFSLASPSPAWPLGLRTTNGGGGRQDNAFMNDLVALLRPHNLAKKVGIGGFQNAGDFRTDADHGAVSLGPHDMDRIIESLNFVKSIRGDLGLSKDITPEFVKKCIQAGRAAFAA